MLDATYNKLKYIISGCRTLDDAVAMCHIFILSKQEKDLMTSIINSKRYDNQTLDLKNMIIQIKEINNCKYREDAYDLINIAMKKTCDAVQIRTLQRLANLKQSKPQFISLKEIRDRNASQIITKQCPHCGHNCSGTRETEYLMCGYTENGYDLIGCGRDWCFNCEKILCKSWENDQLFIPINRTHDNKCCKKHSVQYKNDYPRDYCQCNLSYKIL